MLASSVACHPEGGTLGLRSQARFAQGRPVGSARRLASRRAGPWAPLAGSLRAGQATKDLSSFSLRASESRILRELRMTHRLERRATRVLSAYYRRTMTTEPVRTWESAEAAEVWRKSAARRARTVAAATDKMFEAARLRPGMRVLDLAAGTGDQALLAAQIVGPAGSVLATDISPSMLAVAEESARDAGLSNIETLVADASRVELPDEHFDAAICR